MNAHLQVGWKSAQWSRAVSAYARRDASVQLPVPFEVVSDLVAWRLVVPENGVCTLPATWLDRVLTRLFHRSLRRELRVAGVQLALADERIHALSERLGAAFETLPSSAPQLLAVGTLTEEEIEQVQLLAQRRVRDHTS